jgi:hypothetical protein
MQAEERMEERRGSYSSLSMNGYCFCGVLGMVPFDTVGGKRFIVAADFDSMEAGDMVPIDLEMGLSRMVPTDAIFGGVRGMVPMGCILTGVIGSVPIDF